MPKSGLNVALKGLDDIFSTEESRQEEQREQVQQIPVSELFPFKNHPFKVLDDDSMTRTVESISQFGVLAPLIARPRPEGGYEIISGHRRKHAAELANLDTVPVIVRNMEDDAATILMVDSNLQREHILPSERAFAYKMKLDAIKNQGARSDLTSSQVGTKLRADEKVAKDSGESRNQVQRFVRLTNLVPELLDMVDEKKISFNPAVELSYLDEKQQQDFLEAMCADFNIHDTGNGNPHAHILLTMRPLDEKGTWAAKSKKEYVLDENGERVKLPSGRYKTRKVDLMDWNRQENADLWRKAWADLANDYLERSGSAERIDHRSHAERGIEELPTVHMGVAASQMEKKGIATDKGEINRMIQKTNRLMREIRGYIDSLKEWLAEVFAAKKQLQAAPHSPDIATLLTRYLSIEREKSRKYSQGWQQQHTAGELQKISKAIVYLQSKGIATLEDLDAALSSVDEEAKRLNTSVVAKQKRMRTLEKFIEHGSNYNRLKPIHDELKTLKNGWGKKREKFEQAHESDLIIWNAANRFLHANLPEGTKSFKVSEWQKEFDELKAQSTGEYEELKTKRSEVKELQQIRKCIDIVEQAEQRTQEQTHQTPRRKKEDISL